MNFRSYRWLALVIFLLGLLVLHQGWNHGSLDQHSMQMQVGSPAATSTDKSMNKAGSNSPAGTDKGMRSASGNGQQ